MPTPVLGGFARDIFHATGIHVGVGIDVLRMNFLVL